MTPIKRRLPPTLLLTGAAFIAALFALLMFLLVGLPTTALAQFPSNDATLSGLTVSPRDIIGFEGGPDGLRGWRGVHRGSRPPSPSTKPVTRARRWCTAARTPISTPRGTRSTCRLAANEVTVTVTVTAADTTTTATYTGQGQPRSGRRLRLEGR